MPLPGRGLCRLGIRVRGRLRWPAVVRAISLHRRRACQFVVRGLRRSRPACLHRRDSRGRGLQLRYLFSPISASGIVIFLPGEEWLPVQVAAGRLASKTAPGVSTLKVVDTSNSYSRPRARARSSTSARRISPAGTLLRPRRPPGRPGCSAWSASSRWTTWRPGRWSWKCCPPARATSWACCRGARWSARRGSRRLARAAGRCSTGPASRHISGSGRGRSRGLRMVRYFFPTF
jgi:hypothetical protein